MSISIDGIGYVDLSNSELLAQHIKVTAFDVIKNKSFFMDYTYE
jgi:UDP-glucose 6-dehydrogenase